MKNEISKSNIEEIIAVLWFILAAALEKESFGYYAATGYGTLALLVSALLAFKGRDKKNLQNN